MMIHLISAPNDDHELIITKNLNYEISLPSFDNHDHDHVDYNLIADDDHCNKKVRMVIK